MRQAPARRPPPRSARIRHCRVSRAESAGCLPDPQPPGCACSSFTTCCSTRIGIAKANVEPLLISDSTQMRPPCNSMMRLAIANPKPVPPFFPCDRTVSLLELLENLALVRGGDTGSRITHSDGEGAIRHSRLDRDLALVRELDGIANEVEQDLGKAALVPAADRQVGGHICR